MVYIFNLIAAVICAALLGYCITVNDTGFAVYNAIFVVLNVVCVIWNVESR